MQLKVINTLNKYGVPFTSIAVLTPYAAQKQLVQSMINDNLQMRKGGIKVNTIVESQGQLSMSQYHSHYE